MNRPSPSLTIRAGGWFSRWLGLALALTWLAPVARGEEKFSEPAVKAALVVTFASYVEWPTQTNTTAPADLVIGVLGSDRHQEAFAVAARQREGQPRKFTIRKLSSVSDDARDCQIVFIAADVDASPMLESLKASPVLTVGESATFAESGGMIQLVTVGNNLRFDINLSAAQSVGLKISSKVLNLARRVVSSHRKAGS